jgi:poly(3-hydroxyoctanoate) depolymerase
MRPMSNGLLGPAAPGVSMEARERSVTVAGTRLYVREWGEGRPLLVINGIGANLDMLAPLERGLPGARLIGFDAPGTGRSATSLVPLNMEVLAAMTELLLDRLGYERVDVLGYSFGGLVAQHLARRAPSRVRRLILVATTPGWGGVPGSMWALGQMSTPLRYYWRRYYESVVGELMGGRARDDQSFVRRGGEVRRHNPPTPLGYLWQLLALTGSPGSLGWLSQLSAETLVVTGDDDPVMPLANALLLARYIPGARLYVAPGEGHLLLMDEASQAPAVIRSFLGASDVRRSRAWQQATVVSDQTLADALRAQRAALTNPVALLSALVREMWLLHAPPVQ